MVTMRNCTAAVVVLAALSLTGCVGGGAGQESTTPTTAEKRTPTPSVSASAFLEEMRATEAFFGFGDAQLQQIGRDVCAALDDGSTFDDLVGILALNDINQDQASDIIFASAKEYCPEHER